MTEFPKEKTGIRKEESSSFELILFNDDYHDFNFVIEKLKQHCNHNPEQAEQSALMAHHKGNCSILLGSRERIESVKKKLAFEGLIVDARQLTA